MEARRRQLFHKSTNNNQFGHKFLQEEDSDDEPIPDEIMKLYEDSDDDTNPGPPLREYVPRKKRKFITDKANHFVFFLFVGILVYLIHIAAKKQVNKIKTQIGFEDPKAPPADIWWNHALFYYIYPRSFQDSNGDGIGDIQGILDHMSHFEFLRLNGVILGPLFESPMVDAGRDITDFTAIDPVYGSMQQFEQLVAEFHQRGMRVILELVPNHTSEKHIWFQESRKGGTNNKYADYYIWHPGKPGPDGVRVPPNNWLSRYGGSAWSWDDVRGEYYLHQYDSSMPDLNHRSPQVRTEMIELFSFWMSKDIDGIRMQSANVLFEVEDLSLNEPELTEDDEGRPLNHRKDLHESLDHIYTDDQPEIHEFMATWREHVDNHVQHKGKRIFLTLDCDDDHIGDIIKHYETGADAPYHYFLSQIDTSCDARCLHQMVDSWTSDLPDGKTTLWMLSSPEHGRLISRKGDIYGHALAALQLLLPGSPVIYYGEEIGMTEQPVPFQQTLDLKAKYVGPELYHKYSKDPFRTPMLWSQEKHAGFSTADTTWLPIHEKYMHNNVKSQLHTDGSLLLFYKSLGIIREENNAFKFGGFKFSFTNDAVFSFIRYARDSSPFLVAINIGSQAWIEDFTLTVGMALGKVALWHPGQQLEHSQQRPANYHQGDTVGLDKVTLNPGAVIVFKLF